MKGLMAGNEALAEAAIRAGCKFYFGYPITPQSEIPEYLAKNFQKRGGHFLQTESEVATINMVMGASAAGARAMTSSSSPGISLMQEGISYMVGCELPAVIVDVMRGGPGLGNIAPAQGDYFQMVKGGGHGDYNLIVLAPNSVQEMADLTHLAFDLADKYRNPAVILADGLLGQMIEPVTFKKHTKKKARKPWALTGAKSRKPNIINSLYLAPEGLEAHNKDLQKKFKSMRTEARYESFRADDADIILVAYGTCSRLAKTVVEDGRKEGLKLGLIRPITLWPFPSEAIRKAAGRARALLVVELSAGQMVEDVRLAVNGKKPVHFFGRMGGMVPFPEDILKEAKKI
ncbi:MAG: 3-methyl-2-oxobutanoate dehydrogenase subunit VorB [archaeon]